MGRHRRLSLGLDCVPSLGVACVLVRMIPYTMEGELKMALAKLRGLVKEYGMFEDTLFESLRNSCLEMVMTEHYNYYHELGALKRLKTKKRTQFTLIWTMSENGTRPTSLRLLLSVSTVWTWPISLRNMKDIRSRLCDEGYRVHT